MAFVIGTAQDALLSVEYQRTRSANRWTNGFQQIVKVNYNCKLHANHKITVFRDAIDAKRAIDEIVEREKDISFKDVQAFGYFSIRNKLKIEQLKIYELTLEEVEFVQNSNSIPKPR